YALHSAVADAHPRGAIPGRCPGALLRTLVRRPRWRSLQSAGERGGIAYEERAELTHAVQRARTCLPPLGPAATSRTNARTASQEIERLGKGKRYRGSCLYAVVRLVTAPRWHQNRLRLLDFHGKVMCAPPIGMNDLYQASVGFIDLRHLRVGREAENLQGFRFRHESRRPSAVSPLRIALRAAVRDLCGARAQIGRVLLASSRPALKIVL